MSHEPTDLEDRVRTLEESLRGRQGKSKREKSSLFWRIAGALVLALLIILTWWGFGEWFVGDQKHEDLNRVLLPNERGDAYGTLNTLFSGLAFGGVVYTIWLQMQELSLQREELKASVDAQEDLVKQAKLDREHGQAVRLLNCYADWISTLAALRTRLAPSEPAQDEYLADKGYLQSVESLRSKLAEQTQLLELLDPWFLNAHVSDEAVCKAVGESIAAPSDSGYWSVYDLMHAAATSVSEEQIPSDRRSGDDPHKAWKVTLVAQNLAKHGHHLAGDIIARTRKRFHEVIAAPS